MTQTASAKSKAKNLRDENRSLWDKITKGRKKDRYQNRSTNANEIRGRKKLNQWNEITLNDSKR